MSQKTAAKKRSGKLARRYARALLNSVMSAGGMQQLEPAAQALDAFAQAFATNHDLQTGLLSPMFEREQREVALARILEASGASAAVSNFIVLTFKRDRLGIVGEISAAFRQLADEATRVIPVEVTTANALADHERKELETSLSAVISGRPAFSWSVDPTLIGGVIVSYDGKVIDGSVRGRLENIERELLAA